MSTPVLTAERMNRAYIALAELDERERLHGNDLADRVFVAAIQGILAGPNCPSLYPDLPQVRAVDHVKVLRLAADIAWQASDYYVHGVHPNGAKPEETE